MAIRYRHTQRGTVPLAVAGVAAAILVVSAAAGTATGPVALTAIVVVGLLWLLGSLTVEVTDDAVNLWFGPGWVRKSFAVSAIRSVAAVRNRWWYGWGFRLTPAGWLYNVSGLDAVELRFASGGAVRIGTDEPQRLQAAIAEVIDRR